ncbi:hypothetical protein IF2G_04841 [Cordyceps javanica]|nr:hypothetical protein IF2G_04841 [Cordyceps javanica]
MIPVPTYQRHRCGRIHPLRVLLLFGAVTGLVKEDEGTKMMSKKNPSSLFSPSPLVPGCHRFRSAPHAPVILVAYHGIPFQARTMVQQPVPVSCKPEGAASLSTWIQLQLSLRVRGSGGDGRGGIDSPKTCQHR